MKAFEGRKRGEQVFVAGERATVPRLDDEGSQARCHDGNVLKVYVFSVVAELKIKSLE